MLSAFNRALDVNETEDVMPLEPERSRLANALTAGQV